MRICMICSSPLPPQEGIGFYVWNLSQYLSNRGHKVQVSTRGRRHHPRMQMLDGINVWRPFFLPVYPFHVHLHGLFLNRLVRVLEKETDVFHIHSPLAPVVNTKRPIVLTFHTPMLSDVRAIPIRNLPSVLVNLQLPFSVSLEKQIISKASCVSAVSTSVARELLAYGVQPGDVRVMGNGVDTNLFTPGHEKPNGTPYVLAVGRIGLRKGLEDLVDAARIVARGSSSMQFLVAGMGPLEGSLRKKIRDMGMDRRVKMIGHVNSRKELIKLYRQATIFVHPAHYEGLPTVLLEAMSCGRPVVATAVGGAIDVIASGENGLLVPPHDPSAIADAILRLGSDAELGNRLGQAARETVVERYSWDKISSHYLRVYEETLSMANGA